MSRQVRKPASSKQDYQSSRKSGKSSDSASPAGQAQNALPKEILWAMGAAGRDVLEGRARARRRPRELSITVRSVRPGGPNAGPQAENESVWTKIVDAAPLAGGLSSYNKARQKRKIFLADAEFPCTLKGDAVRMPRPR